MKPDHLAQHGFHRTTFINWGMRHSWLTHCATSRNVTRDSWWCHWNFHWQSFRPPCGPGIDWASKRNEYQGIELTLPTSCTECPEIWEPQPPAALQACPDLYRDSFTFIFYIYPLGLLYNLNSS